MTCILDTLNLQDLMHCYERSFNWKIIINWCLTVVILGKHSKFISVLYKRSIIRYDGRLKSSQQSED